jgi:hypothetical protein
MNSPFGRRPSNCVVLVAPDEQGWHSGRSHRRVMNSSRPIPSQRGLHSLRVADDGQVGLNRGLWHTVLGQARPQPVSIFCQDVRAGIRLQECPMVSGRRRCSPSVISSARANASGCGRDRMVSDANRSGC